MLSEMFEQFKPALEQSFDGVYLHLGDFHKVCNKNMADLFGLKGGMTAVPDFLE